MQNNIKKYTQSVQTVITKSVHSFQNKKICALQTLITFLIVLLLNKTGFSL